MISKRKSPVDRIKDSLVDIPASVLNHLPEGYKRFGNVMVLYLPDILTPYCKRIGEQYLKEFGVEAVINIKRVYGDLRIPDAELIAGMKRDAIYKENSVIYEFDPLHIMFSPGNKHVRKVIADDINKNDVVVDMFAGIGYFSIPAVKKEPDIKVYAIEKNATSYHYLIKNIKQNHAENNIIPVYGDCRNIYIGNVATKIFMGYFGNTIKYLPYALNFASKNCVIYFHDVMDRSNGLDRSMCNIKNVIKNTEFIINGDMETMIVKEVSKTMVHGMIRIPVSKKNDKDSQYIRDSH